MGAMPLSADRLITAEEFAQMPEEPGYELVRGRLVEVPRGRVEHGALCANVTGLLWVFVREHDLGNVTCNDTGHWIARDPDTVRGPDVGFVAKERIPASGLPAKWWEHAPDLVVEVISKHDTYAYVEDRTRDWLDGGAREVWSVDPRRREVKIVTQDAAPRVCRGGEPVATEVLTGFAASADDVFAV